MSQMLMMYNSVGNAAFSQMIGQIAPFFATINAQFVALKPNYAEITMPFCREVTNHLGTVHAIAMCNMAELAGGLMTDVSIPQGSRWIPSGMTVKYLKKAKTDLVAEAKMPAVDWSTVKEVIVPVEIRDTQQQLVFTAEITMNIKHK